MPSPLPAPGTTLPSGRLAPPVAIADQGIVTDAAADGTLWAAGPSWKAAFAPAGTMFVPCFGSTAPRNFPADLQRADVTVGGKALANAPVPPTLADGVVEYRGEEFTERFVLHAAGIEQQFVFETLASRGALQVTVPFSTELTVGAAEDGGFRFRNEYGSFGYGHAIAIDADGDRLSLATEWNGSGFTITVPAAFVAEATLPLLVDPLIGSVVPYAADTKPIATTDLAYDASLGRYALVHERVFSATDSDVYVRYLMANLQFATTTLAIDLSLDSWRGPQVAALEAHDEFLVVAQKSTGNVAPFRAFGRLVVGATPTIQAPFQVFAQNTDVSNLDVGGNPAPTGPTRFLVTAEYHYSSLDHDIYGVAVNADGTLGPNVVVDGSIGHQIKPQVSNSCGMPGGSTEAWAIGYYHQLSPTTVSPRIGFVSLNFNVITTATMPGGHPLNNASIAVSSPTDHEQGRLFALTTYYEIAGGSEVHSALWTRNGSLQADSGTWVAGTLPNGQARLDCDGTRFVLALPNRTPGVRTDVAFHLLGKNLNFLASQNVDFAGSMADSAPAVIADRSGGGTGHGYTLAWVEAVSPTSHVIEWSRYDGIQSGAQLAFRSTGCGGLGITWGGSTTLGSTLQATLPGASGLAGFLVGFPVDVPVAPCPGCRQGVDGTTQLGAVFTLNVPRNAAFVGLTVAMQGFQFDAAVGSGACLGQINLSDTIDATIR